MKYFQKIATYDVAPVLSELTDHPELWNRHSQRTKAMGSPHAASQDIWLRYRAFEELTSPDKYNEPHEAVFYPAWRDLPSLHDIVADLYVRVDASRLGGLLITRIKAGNKILPHRDSGWHPEFYNCKVYLPVQANDQCVNYCGDEEMVIKAGDAVSFNNLITHSVDNNGTTDRITLIVCMKV